MRRGEVYELRLPSRGGHEQAGRGFGVIVQSDAMLPRSTVLIAPTSTRARAASFRPDIDVDGTSTRVLVEHTGAVDVSRLGRLVGRVTGPEQWGIDDALATVLDLR